MDTLFNFLKSHEISLTQVGTVVAILLATAVADFAIRFFFQRWEKTTHSETSVKTLFYLSLNKPLRLVTLILGFYFTALNIFTWFNLTTILDQIVTPGVEFSLAFCFLILMNAFLERLKTYYIKKQTRTDGGYNNFAKIEQMHKLGQAATIVITGFIAARILGFQIGQGIAYFGGGMAIIALVFKDTISSIFGGVIIYLDAPYAVGDWIYTVDGKIEGTVEKISWRLTHIRTFDKRLIFVPNNLLITQAVVNASRMSNRRILQYIGLRYDDFDKFEAIQKDIYSYLGEHQDIDPRCLTLVNVVNGSTNMGSVSEGFYGGSSLNFQIYTFTKVTNWLRFQAIQDKIMMDIGRIIYRHGAEIAFSTITLDMPKEVEAPQPQAPQKSTDT